MKDCWKFKGSPNVTAKGKSVMAIYRPCSKHRYKIREREKKLNYDGMNALTWPC